MKIITEKYSINTKGDCDIINITENVQSLINKHNFNQGNATVFVVGSTASISTIEYEPGLKKTFPRY